MNKKTLLIIGGIVAVMALCACVAIAGFVFYKVGQDTADPVSAASTEIAATLDAPAEDATPEASPTEAEPVLANNQAKSSGEEIKEKWTIPDDPYKVSQELTEKSKQTATDFLNTLMDKKYEEAVSMITQEMQENGGTVDTFRTIVEDKNLEAQEWAWTAITQKDQYINMEGVVHFKDQRRGLLRMELYSEGDNLLVSFLDIKPDGMTDPGPYTTWTTERKQEEDIFAIESAAGFLNGWADNKIDSAWSFTGNALRDSLNGDKQNLSNCWKKFGITPTNWTWDKTIQRVGVTAEHPTTIFTGSIQCKEGGPDRKMEVFLEWEDGYWNVTNINLIQP